MTRSRTRTTSASSGSWNYFGSPVGDPGYEFQNSSETCIDEPSIGDMHPFSVERWRYDGGLINALSNNESHNHNPFKDRYCGWVRNLDAYARSHVNTSGRGLDLDYGTRILKGTNPSRPLVDLPQDLLEMHQIPHLLEEEGTHWLKSLASANVRYHFGIAPLVGDMFKMCQFADATERRIAELQKLATGHLGKKIVLDQWEDSVVTGPSLFESLGIAISGRLKKHSKHKVYGYARWSTGQPLPSNNRDMRRLAYTAVSGLSFDFSTAWNLIPWTWFADWFLNIGDYLIAHRNTVGAVLDGMSLMRHSVTRTTSFAHVVPAYYSFSPISCEYETKSREPISATLEAKLPILNESQLGILGSIDVRRRLGR